MAPLSLRPTAPDDALFAFMQVDPKKVEDCLKRDGVKKDKK
jgi:hypothetical protein